MIGEIEITGASLESIVRAAYSPSRPQGLGVFHFQPGDLTDEEVASLVRPDNHFPVSMDYVKGRSIKMTVFQRDGKLFIPNRWYDHTDASLENFLKAIGIPVERLHESRKEQDEHHTKWAEKAVEFVKEKGGSFTDEYDALDGQDDLRGGLYWAQEAGKLKRDFDAKLWRLIA